MLTLRGFQEKSRLAQPKESIGFYDTGARDRRVRGPNYSRRDGRNHAGGKQSRKQSTIEHEHLQILAVADVDRASDKLTIGCITVLELMHGGVGS
jgi:hypothetical protein